MVPLAPSSPIYLPYDTNSSFLVVIPNLKRYVVQEDDITLELAIFGNFL